MSEFDICDVKVLDKEKVESLKNELVNTDIEGTARFFKAIAEENRAKIVFALMKEHALCVCDIAAIIDASIANTSSHLRKLYKQGIIKFHKKGKQVFYELDDDHIIQLMEITLIHKKEVDERNEYH